MHRGFSLHFLPQNIQASLQVTRQIPTKFWRRGFKSSTAHMNGTARACIGFGEQLQTLDLCGDGAEQASQKNGFRTNSTESFFRVKVWKSGF